MKVVTVLTVAAALKHVVAHNPYGDVKTGPASDRHERDHHPAHRTACEQASPNPNTSQLFPAICLAAGANSTTAEGDCLRKLAVHDAQHVASHCITTLDIYAQCSLLFGLDNSVCEDLFVGYNNCENFVVQSYAYCACIEYELCKIEDCVKDQTAWEEQVEASELAAAMKADNKTELPPRTIIPVE